MTIVRPPKWAERVLRSVLARRDRDTVSGDLLEEYGEVVVPRRGQGAADRWYVRQIAGYAVRSNIVWAVLFAGAYVARQAYDAFVPTQDFLMRSTVTTYLAIVIVIAAGFLSAWRSGSPLAGMLAGFVTTALAAVLSEVGIGLLLVGWHDPATLDAIRGSGGVEEMFLLPVMLVIPGTILGTLAGVIGAGTHGLTRIDVT